MSRRGLLKGSRRKAIAKTPAELHDLFLNEATHTVAGLWEDNGGARMGTHELYALNDVLTAFFADKKVVA